MKLHAQGGFVIALTDFQHLANDHLIKGLMLWVTSLGGVDFFDAP
jgi:hypothetical protein